MKQKATIRYYYKRAFLPLILCTATFAVFTLLTASGESILPVTALGFNGRFFWCACMFFTYKSFENLFCQQSVSRKAQFRALVGFLPFSFIAAAVNLLLCYVGILLSGRYWQQQISAYGSVSSAEMPKHLFLGLTGFSEYGSATFLIALGILLHALSVMRGMLFGALLSRLFHKFPRRIALMLTFGGAAIFVAICILIANRYGISNTYDWGSVTASFFFGNSGANATLSVLFADIYMLCLYLILLRLTDGTVSFKKPNFRKHLTRAAIAGVLILMCGICNVLLCTPTPVNTLERTKTQLTDSSGNSVTKYTDMPNEQAFRLLKLQAKAAMPAYRTACLSALAQNYYLNDALETVDYADGAAIFDELLQTFENNIGSFSVYFPLLYSAQDTFSALENADTPYNQKTEVLQNACLYFTSHGEPARAIHTYSAAVQPEIFSSPRDVFMCESALNCITIHLDSEQDRLWAAEQMDVLADRLETFGSENGPSTARLRQSAASLRGEKIPDSETVTAATDV